MSTYQPLAVDGETVGGWYLYRFETDLRCAIPDNCTHDHPLYRGKSNEPLRRLLEHAKDQPWWPYVTGWSVDPQVYASDEDVRAAEKAAILAELPLANKEHNGRNAHRLDFGQPVPRAPRARAVRPAGRRAVTRRRSVSWGWLWTRPVGYVALWLVLAVAGLVAAVHWTEAGVVGGAKIGAGGASGLYVLAWLNRKPKRGNRKSSNRRRK